MFAHSGRDAARWQLTACPAGTYRPIMTTPLRTGGDLARGQPPELTTVIDCHGWSRLPGTDVEVRAFTDKPFVLRYRSARVPQDWTAQLDLNPRPLRPELRAGRSMVVISAGRRPAADVVGRCWSAALLYCAAVPLRWPRTVGTGHGPGN